MAFPASPPQVGLTVAKSELEFSNGGKGTVITTSGSMHEGRIFRGVTRLHDGVTGVTFRECWFYCTVFEFYLLYGTGNPTGIRFERCEFGISSSDSTALDPDGFTGWTAGSMMNGIGEYEMVDCYIHHQSDGVYFGSGLIDHCYIADFVYTGADEQSITVHADQIQMTGPANGATIRDSYITLNLAPDNVYGPGTGHPNATIFAQSIFGDITDLTVSGCYLDGHPDAFYILRTNVAGYAIDRVAFTGNRFGRNFANGGAPILVHNQTTNVTRYDNRFADDLSLVPGDQTAPATLGTMFSSDRFTRYQNSAVTSSASIFGPQVQASATPHTKGSWVQLAASAGFDVYLVGVTTRDMTSNGVDTSALLDIGIDTAGGSSYTAVIPNILVGHSNADDGRTVWFPIYIPAGSSVGARMQCIVGSQTGRVGVQMLGGINPNNPRRFRSSITTYGITEASSSGVSPPNPSATNTKSTWQNVGTASRSHQGFVVACQGAADAMPGSDGLLDIGIDTAGGSSYTTIVGNVFVHTVGTERIFTVDPMSCLLSRPIPSGSTIGIRSQGTDAGALSSLDFAIYAF